MIFSKIGFQTQKKILIKEDFQKGLKVSMAVAEAVQLEQVVLTSEINELHKFVAVDIQNNPVQSSQELLRKVPGLIIGQHAGGGKAEQLFLRGFDIDHGTDVAIGVDGMPVNLVSHAHGQGYADLHFVIPETIENIDFGKGLYYADKGNFNTAGYVEFQTKKRLKQNAISLEAGQFNTFRGVGLFNVLDNEYSSAYLASEVLLTDGFFESPQNFNRFNVFGKYYFNNYEDQEVTISLSHFQSRWDASGQIPTRAVTSGQIGRFGAIDDTEGGETSRSNLVVNHTKKINSQQRLQSVAYMASYDFELFSNFTFFLENRPNGANDQIRQSESRTVTGANTDYQYVIDTKKRTLKMNLGAGFRYDNINEVELAESQNRRETLNRLSYGDVDELNGFSYLNFNWKKDQWSVHTGLRLDYFKFGFDNFLSPVFDNATKEEVVVSPKFSVIHATSKQLQLFAKAGFGFHSNDSRVLFDTETAVDEALPSAFGIDLGAVYKPTANLVFNANLWSLFSEQEFVYVGDGGVVEPSGASRRLGVDLGTRYQINKWWYANIDANYTFARSVDAPEGEDFIPLAPNWTANSGLSIKDWRRFSANWNFRYLNDRPANEDNSIVAEGYFVNDFNCIYRIYKQWNVGLIVENILDTKWNETQFATLTRLPNEPQEGIEDITFTPGTPFSIRGKLAVRF